jgi:excisionase family DNA binding protein
MAQGLEKGGSGVGGLGAELAVGASIAQQMLNQPGGIAAQATQAAAPKAAPPATSAPGDAALPELVGPAEAAKLLGVSEADVIASLDAGDLKGKKIGSQWRIRTSAIREFLG